MQQIFLYTFFMTQRIINTSSGFIFLEKVLKKQEKSFILNLLNFPANWLDSLLKQLVWFKILPWSKTARISRSGGLWVFRETNPVDKAADGQRVQQVVLRINKPIRECGVRSFLIRKKRN